jgi:hypothetical protein
VLTTAQREEFECTGILRLPAVFVAAEGARMCDVVWNELQRRYGIDRDDRATWNRHPPTGLKSSKKHSAFAPTFGPAVRDALDDLLGVGEWRAPKHFGQVLVTMPNAKEWRVPHRLWHGDFLYDFAPASLPMVKCWTLCADHAPGSGATPQLAGSHRLVGRYIDDRAGPQLEYKRVRDGFLRSHPWLKALSTDDEDPERNARFMSTDADIDGLPARVVECSGSAGDVYITHPWVMHSIALNAGKQPRMMRSVAVYRDDYLTALEESRVSA